MHVQTGIFPVHAEDYPRVVEVWEASVRATHDFVSSSDIEIFRPIVRDVLPKLVLACVRDEAGAVAGFIAVGDVKVEMLFIHPDCRGQGAGRRLMTHAVETLGATEVDVNEQNEQAVGFYLHLGFETFRRSELDGMGKPYPILHMRKC
ncbi:MAG: GNAT family N-acetyltransferase [Chloroflexi bacterium]|nr:GNAT family N-acetyltransferase [Chloroflexota bacterium]